MRIGLDASHALARGGERAEFIKNFVEEWASLFPLDEIYLYIPKMVKRSVVSSLLQRHNVSIHLPGPAGFQGKLWRMFGITNHLKADGIELFIGLEGLLPVNINNAGVKTLLIDDSAIKRGFIERLVYKKSLAEAGKIINKNVYSSLSQLIEEIRS